MRNDYQKLLMYKPNLVWLDSSGGHSPIEHIGFGHGSRQVVSDLISSRIEMGQRFDMFFEYSTRQRYGHFVSVELPSTRYNGKPIVVDA